MAAPSLFPDCPQLFALASSWLIWGELCLKEAQWGVVGGFVVKSGG